MRCPHCHQKVDEKDNFCRYCGHMLDSSSKSPKSEENKPGIYYEIQESPVLKAGHEINIEVEGENSNVRYDSRVAEINEDEILILLPFEEGKPLNFEPGQEITVFIPGSSAAYQFPSQIIDIQKEPKPMLTLSRPDNEQVKKVQRRNYFRLEVERRVWYRPVNHLDEPLTEDFVKTRSLEISGGGMRLIMHDIETSDVNQMRLETKLDIPPLEETSIIARLVNIYGEAETKEGKIAGIKFVDLHYEDRDKLMGWLFEEQRQRREKGLI